MKIHANSFDVDMNALLNQMNGHNIHGYYNKMIYNTGQKVQKMQDKINKNINDTESEFNGKHNQIKELLEGHYNKVNQKILDNYKELSKNQRKNVIDLTSLANGNHDDAVNQINQTWGILKGTTITVDGQKITLNNASDILRASHLEGKQIAREMTDQINTLDKNNQAMWNHAVPPAVNRAMDAAINNVPTSTTYYYPMGQYPDNPSPGDVVWQTPDPQDYGSNDIQAKAYRYYSQSGWQPIKGANQDVFGSNILGANVKGGMITGATFRSNQQGNNGAPFSVNRDGRLYAREFVSDLEHKTVTPALNECVYYGYLDGDGNDHNEGGFALKNGLISMRANVAQSTGMYSWDYQSHMRGQTFLEPGYLKLRYLGDIGYVRSDLRAGILEIAADSWNQNAGIRLGYLDGPSGQSPATLWMDGWSMYEKTNGSDALTFHNQRNKGMVDFDSPVNIKGDLAINNKVRIKGVDVGNRFEKSEKKIAGHDSVIGNHTNRLDRHRQELDQHEQWLYNHDDLFRKHGQKLNQFTNDLNQDGDVLTKHGRLLDSQGDQITSQSYTLDSHGNLLNSHGQKLSQHDTDLIEHQSQLSDHENHLGQHDTHLSTHDGNIQDLFNQLGNKLSYTDTIQGGNINFGSSLNVGQAQIFNDGEIDCNNLFLGGTMITLSGSRNSIDVDGTLLATYEWVKDNFTRSSRLSVKRDVHNVDSKRALTEVLNTDIKGWNYRKDPVNEKVHYGPIIDDINNRSNEKYYTPAPLLTNDKEDQGIDIADSVSFLFLSIQELEKQNSQLTQRVAKLELDKRK